MQVQEPLAEKCPEPTRIQRAGWRERAENREEVIQAGRAEEHRLRDGQKEEPAEQVLTS